MSSEKTDLSGAYKSLVHVNGIFSLPVNVTDMSPTHDSHFVDGERQFSSRVEIYSKQACTLFSFFNVCIKGKKEITIRLTEKESIVVLKENPNCVRINFSDTHFIDLEFKEPLEFESFHKLVKEVLRIERFLKEKKKEKRFKFSNNRLLCKYVIPPKYKEKVSLSGNVSNVEYVERQFFETPSENWSFNQFLDWLNHIFIQLPTPDSDGSNITTLFRYVSQNNLTSLFEGYLSPENHKNTSTLLRNIERFEKDPENFPLSLEHVLKDEVVRESLRKECKELKNANGMFNIHYHLIMEKSITNITSQSSKEKTQSMIDIEQISTFLKKRKHLWSVDDCFFMLLKSLLKTDLKRLIDELESKFYEEEKSTTMNRSKENDNDNNNEVESYVFSIDPVQWAELLKKFNRTNHVVMENLSPFIKLSFEQNEMRIKRSELLKSKENEEKKYNDMMNDMEEVSKRIENTENVKKNLNQKIQQQQQQQQQKQEEEEEVDDKTEDDSIEEKSVRIRTDVVEKRLKRVENFLQNLSKEHLSLEVEMKNSQEIIERLEKVEIPNLEQELVNKYEIFVEQKKKKERNETDDEIMKMMNSKKRNEALMSYIFEKEQGNSIGHKIGVYFIVSIPNPQVKEEEEEKKKEREKKKKKKKKKSSKEKDILHHHLLFTNGRNSFDGFSIHWEQNDMTRIISTKEEYDKYVSRFYEPIFVQNCDVPVLSNISSLLPFLTRLSEEIITSNLNHEYTKNTNDPIAFKKKKKKKKGEYKVTTFEFCFKILNSLNYTHFHEQEKEYILYLSRAALRRWFQRKKSFMKKLRSLKMSEDFKESHSILWKKNSELKIKKNIIYFHNHHQLDTFITLLEGLWKKSEVLPVQYRHVYQLLRGIDLAFWFNERGGEEVKNCSFSLKIPCTFFRVGDIAKEVNIVKKVEEEEEEEEEEVEGEDIKVD